MASRIMTTTPSSGDSSGPHKDGQTSTFERRLLDVRVHSAVGSEGLGQIGGGLATTGRTGRQLASRLRTGRLQAHKPKAK